MPVPLWAERGRWIAEIEPVDVAALDRQATYPVDLASRRWAGAGGRGHSDALRQILAA